MIIQVITGPIKLKLLLLMYFLDINDIMFFHIMYIFQSDPPIKQVVINYNI